MELNKKDSYFLFYVMVSGLKEAEGLARSLVEDKLAACVNVLPGIKSFYWWKGNMESADECLLMGKTTVGYIDEIKSSVVALHSYEVPEIVFVALSDGYNPYLDWIDDSLDRG